MSIIREARTQLIPVPATYKTITSQEMLTPATTKEVITPAVYRTVERRVVVTAPTTKEIKIPATYTKVVLCPSSKNKLQGSHF